MTSHDRSHILVPSVIFLGKYPVSEVFQDILYDNENKGKQVKEKDNVIFWNKIKSKSKRKIKNQKSKENQKSNLKSKIILNSKEIQNIIENKNKIKTNPDKINNQWKLRPKLI